MHVSDKQYYDCVKIANSLIAAELVTDMEFYQEVAYFNVMIPAEVNWFEKEEFYQMVVSQLFSLICNQEQVATFQS